MMVKLFSLDIHHELGFIGCLLFSTSSVRRHVQPSFKPHI